MANLTRRISMEAAGIESRISRGELAELLKDKMERRLEKERKELQKQQRDLLEQALAVPKKWKPMFDEIDRVSPYKHVLKIDGIWYRRDEGDFIKLQYMPSEGREAKKDHPGFDVNLEFDDLSAEPGFEHILEAALKIRNIGNKLNEVVNKLNNTRDNSFRTKIVESSLTATDDGRALIDQMDGAIDAILEELE